jgi:hypothetical protein
MLLYKVTKITWDGVETTEYIRTAQLSFKSEGHKGVFVTPIKYDYEHPILPPSIVTTKDGKKYVVPTWQEINPLATLEDIKWVPKKTEPKPESKTWTFKSSSSDTVYKVKQIDNTLKCNCMGFFRAKDRRCKHIKSVEKEINKMSKI